MTHEPSTVANSLLEIANHNEQPVSPMKLQKLVFFSHGWHLGFGLGPLSSEPAEAWQWGPVFPSLYHAVKVWGNGSILDPILQIKRDVVDGKPRYTRSALTIPPSDVTDVQLLSRIWEVYGGMTAMQLSQISHEPGGPWEQARQSGRRSTIIPDESIERYFRAKIDTNAVAP